MVMLIGLGAACLLIRLGMTLYQCGLVRAKNAAATTLAIISDSCVAVLAFWVIGAAILTQTHNGIFYVDWKRIAFRSGGSSELFFLATVVLIGSGIPSGVVAERARLLPMWAISFLTAGLLVP